MDVEVIESGNGGDLVKKAKDLSVIFGFENMIYLAMFGGNVEASTPSKRLESEQGFDFWGNNLLWPNDSSVQFNSITERRLKEVALSSSGRVQIEQGIKQDLQFMSSFAEVTVSATIISTDRLRVSIIVKRIDNLQEREFIYIWDSTISELEAAA